jgi:hypothetical protein
LRIWRVEGFASVSGERLEVYRWREDAPWAPTMIMSFVVSLVLRAWVSRTGEAVAGKAAT